MVLRALDMVYPHPTPVIDSCFHNRPPRLEVRLERSLRLRKTGLWSAYTIGVSSKGMASIIGRAKRLRREGHFPAEDFKEIKLADGGGTTGGLPPCSGIEVAWENGKLIRFNQVDQLVEFLKKVA
jgi:hypothetical protein